MVDGNKDLQEKTVGKVEAQKMYKDANTRKSLRATLTPTQRKELEKQLEDKMIDAGKTLQEEISKGKATTQKITKS